MVAPHWPPQPWHLLLQLETDEEIRFPKQPRNLSGTIRLVNDLQQTGLAETKLMAYFFGAKPLKGYNIDLKTLNYFHHTWRPITKKNYVTHINRWALWALEKGIGVLEPTYSRRFKIFENVF